MRVQASEYAMTSPRKYTRSSDVEVAVLTHKVDALTEHVVSHMAREEEDRKEIWQELRKLDRRFLVFFTAILATAGGPNILSVIESLPI